MNQKDLLLSLMLKSGHVTKVVADSYRIGNIKGRINDLRNDGWAIKTEFHVDAYGKRYARYMLADADEERLVRGYLDTKYPQAA